MLILIFLVGIIIGSFLNVVIHRYPLMLRQQCERDYHTRTTGAVSEQKILTLSVPGSHCPHCLHTLRVYDIIPVLSWLVLKGKCRDCGTLISRRYPLVELLTGAMFLAAAMVWTEFYWSVAVMALSALLIAGSLIDIDHHWLPDVFTQSVLWIGISLAWVGISPLTLHQAISGALVGYISFFCIRTTSSQLMKKEALGMGDVWLFAGIGAWIGWIDLTYVALTASVTGLVYGLCAGKISGHMAFGPFLSLGGLGVIFYQGIFPG
ncbi:TPA: A24 family peptidase [Salmonella enterica subsp. enterica serovar Virchow]